MLDSARDEAHPTPEHHALPHQCGMCTRAFASARMLMTHQRSFHGTRNPLKKFIGSDARCPVCLSVFSSRLRAIAHVTEKRRRGKGGRAMTCHERLQSGLYPSLSPEELQRLDAADTLARRIARKSGRSQPRSSAPVVRERARVRPISCFCQGTKRRIPMKSAACVTCMPPVPGLLSGCNNLSPDPGIPSNEEPMHAHHHVAYHELPPSKRRRLHCKTPASLATTPSRGSDGPTPDPKRARAASSSAA